MSTARQMAFIQRLYASGLDERLWTGMAEHLAGLFDAPSANIKIYHPDQPAADILQVTANIASAGNDPSWAAHWHNNDLWVNEAMRRKVTGAGTSELLMSDADLMRTGYYNEWLRPLSIHSMVGAMVPLDAAGQGAIAIHRPQGSPHFDQQDVRTLNMLIPHLRITLRVRRHLHEMSTGMKALDEALTSASLAVVAVDEDARLLLANQHAETLLRSGAPLHVKSGRLGACTSQNDAALKHHIRSASRLKSEDSAHTMRLRQPGAAALRLSFMPLLHRSPELHTQRAAVLVLIQGISGPADKATAQLKQLFAFTPTEARVAVALAQGLTPERIAQSLQVGLGTVRTHLKSAMAKTGAHRQAQLVALVWRCVGPLQFHPPTDMSEV